MKYILVLLFFVHAFAGMARDYLFKSGSSDYSIVLPESASPVAQQAAQDLQNYIKEVGGVTLPIVKSQTTCGIVLTEQTSTTEGYHYYKRGESLYIEGAGKRGLLYGTYSFLEKELGVHWFTPDYTQIPKKKSCELRSIDVESEAAFPYRLDYYYGALNNNEWCAHNLLNTQNIIVNNPALGGMESWWGAHSFGRLLPAKSYFAKHPEYFSLRSGKRIENGQLCLSNPEVLRLVTQNLLNVIRSNPGYYVYDVSQNDNQNYCECENCKRIAQQYGGQSGLMIWFVNQVAEQVAKVYPDKMIGTFAYRYTRQIPKNIVPRSNVAIRLCSFECCFCHPLEDCERNQAFLADLQSWSKISSNVHVWDYCVGFMQYVAPHPYFRALQKRLQTFHQYHVSGVLELGQYESEWGDFSELRQWMVPKLLWNPQQDADSLAQVFIEGYYSKAASEIMDFYLLTQNIVKDDLHFTIYCDYKNSSYAGEYLPQSRKLVDAALKKTSGDATLTRRVNRVAAQVYYLQVLRSFPVSVADGTYAKLKKISEDDPTYFIEHKVNFTGALKHWGYI